GCGRYRNAESADEFAGPASRLPRQHVAAAGRQLIFFVRPLSLGGNMRWFYLVVLACSCVAVHCPIGRAVDYGKIDRRIKAEPVYKSKSPKYGLLLFGREAKVRVWVVLDGGTVYLDRNGDGDLTGTNERFASFADCK